MRVLAMVALGDLAAISRNETLNSPECVVLRSQERRFKRTPFEG
jgi:hypothetical protein